MSTIKVNAIENRTGSTLTLGKSGTTIQMACGATQTGFGRTGTVDWCTTAKTSPFTAANGKGYFINTTCGAVTVTLPSSPSAGDIVAFNDVNGKFDCNQVTLCRNGSKLKGGCTNLVLKDERMSATVIYSGASQGWVTIENANVSGATMKENAYNVRYLVVAGGGGGGGTNHGSGGGAGGFRTISCASFQVSVGTPLTVTVGAGGTGQMPSTAAQGSSSVFSTITSAGGGAGVSNGVGGNGGSGAGGGSESGGPHTGGSGNTPPVSPSQGNNGGPGAPSGNGTGGGGGANAVGTAGGAPGCNAVAGGGGAGETNNILGSIPQAPSYGEPGPAPGRYFAGGGGGASENGCMADGGVGGGGDAGPGPASAAGAGQAGVANTGGGGGGGGRGGGVSGDYPGGTGGSGIVILRHATSDASPSVSGGNVTATCGSDTIRIFTGSGTFTP
jgi:hypothetical protein